MRLAQAAENLPERLLREISGPSSEAAAEEVGAGEAYIEVAEDEVLDGQILGGQAVGDLVSQAAIVEEEPVLEVSPEEGSENLPAAEAEAATEARSLIAAPDAPDPEIPALSQKTQEELAAVVGNAEAAPEVAPTRAETAPPKQKPLFWSAALNPPPDAGTVAEADQAMFRQYCGVCTSARRAAFRYRRGACFAWSVKRKKWRGQLRLATPRRNAAPGAVAGAASARRPFGRSRLERNRRQRARRRRRVRTCRLRSRLPSGM